MHTLTQAEDEMGFLRSMMFRGAAVGGVIIVAFATDGPTETVAAQDDECFAYWDWKKAIILWPDEHYHGGRGTMGEVGWTYEGEFKAVSDSGNHEQMEGGYAGEFHSEYMGSQECPNGSL